MHGEGNVGLEVHCRSILILPLLPLGRYQKNRRHKRPHTQILPTPSPVYVACLEPDPKLQEYHDPAPGGPTCF